MSKKLWYLVGCLGIALVSGGCSVVSSSSSENEFAEETQPDEADSASVVLEASGNFEPADCEFEVPNRADASCGWLTVPTDWDNPDSIDDQPIQLHVGVLTIEETPKDATPLVYLEGGPGGDSLSTLSLAYGNNYSDIVRDRPLVLYSQRGAEFSKPDLVCEEFTEFQLELLDQNPTDEEIVSGADSAIGECAERLTSEGADFSEATSENAARDLDAVREALGYESWSIYSISYGTRLAQSYMRLFSDNIDSVVLDSVQPTDPDTAVGRIASNAERSFDLLFAECRADPSCFQRYPDLEARFYALYDELEKSPISFSALDLESFSTRDVTWDGDSMVASAFSALYAQEAFVMLPSMVSQLESGETEVAQLLTSIELFSLDLIASGMNNAVLCNDAFRYIEQDSYLDAASSNETINKVFAIDPDGYQDLQGTCNVFGDSLASAVDIEPVVSDVPVLVTAGMFDPITPPSNGQLVAETLSNSKFVLFPTLGHGVIGTDCGNELITEFVTNPEVELDTSCIAEMPAIEFE